MLQNYAITTLIVTYFVFILTFSYTVLDQYGRVNSKLRLYSIIFFQLLPSQRQDKKQELYDVWVCLHKRDGWVVTGNCTCMGG